MRLPSPLPGLWRITISEKSLRRLIMILTAAVPSCALHFAHRATPAKPQQPPGRAEPAFHSPCGTRDAKNCCSPCSGCGERANGPPPDGGTAGAIARRRCGGRGPDLCAGRQFRAGAGQRAGPGKTFRPEDNRYPGAAVHHRYGFQRPDHAPLRAGKWRGGIRDGAPVRQFSGKPCGFSETLKPVGVLARGVTRLSILFVVDRHGSRHAGRRLSLAGGESRRSR